MQLEVNPKELASAIGAIQALMKKMPREVATNEAALSFMLNKDWSYYLIAAFDAFSVSVPIKSMKVIGNDDIMEPWTGGNISLANVLGIVDDVEMQKILAKVDAKKYPTVIIEYENGKHYLNIRTNDTDFYHINVMDPKKVLSNYGEIIGDISVLSLSDDELVAFCDMTAEIANLISASVEQLAFECVFLSSEESPAGEKVLRLSGTSQANGFSLICNTDTPTINDFTALLHKDLAGGLKGFIKCFPAIQNATIGVVPDDTGAAKMLSIHSDAFSLWLSCMSSDFPFASINMVMETVASPPSLALVSVSALKKALDRISIVAKGTNDDLFTAISLLDGGVMALKQYGKYGSGVVASENIETDRIILFPDDLAEISTMVRTSVLKNILSFYVDDFVYIAIHRGRNKGSNGKMVLSSGTDLKSSLTSVLLGAVI